ncbi:hypothetical protein TSUD_121860 [Trifolium subterraneum]|nr:hypothetical protein TSUD_121860 [Trifolium subterraneum]
MRKRTFQKTLLHRVKSFKSKHLTADEIVKYLKSEYFTDYHLHGDKKLLRLVQIALHQTHSSKNIDQQLQPQQDHDDDDDRLLIKQEETTLHNDKSSMSCDSVLASDSEFNNRGENVTNDVNVRKDGPRFKDLGGMDELETAECICASEESIRELFAQAKRTAPSIIFIDEIDAIATKRDNTQRLMETRIVTQLMICIEKANDDSEASDEPHRHVLVIGATNKPNAIDSSLRRPGRFDREITIGIPDESGREKILTVVTRKQNHDSSVDLRKLAKSTSGFVGADLEALANEAGIVAMNRISNEMKLKLSQDLTNEPDEDSWKKPLLSDDDIEKCAITMSDFEEAIKTVQPSLTREGFSAIPNVKWEDVGALDHVREEFDNHILKPIKHPDDFKVDALTPDRDYESGQVLKGVVDQLLVELDGGEQRKGVFVIGATNRFDAIDEGLKRPGRFGIQLEVPLPSPDDRVKILETLAKDRPIDNSVDLSVIGRMKECENFSGADLAALVCLCSLYFFILSLFYFAYVRFNSQTLQNHIRVG